MQKICLISTSLRDGSNSDLLADAFMKGANKEKNIVEKVVLKNRNIGFCIGCLVCQGTHECILEDDAQEIVEKMRDADILVFATPIYYYEMAGQLKTLLDRANPLFGASYRFRKVYLLATAAEDAPHVPEKAINGLQGWVDCFDGVKLEGVLFAGGFTYAKEIEGSDVLQQAYEFGKKIAR